MGQSPVKPWIGIRQWLQTLTEPAGSGDVDALLDDTQTLPTLWLLGKTGAGKSTLVELLTGDSAVEIGNGFEPCTKSALHYDFPADEPLLRFLDTRGLAEADYDPAEDLAWCGDTSHAALLVLRIGDPDIADVARALQALGRERRRLPMLLVFTDTAPRQVDAESSRQRERLSRDLQDTLESAAGRSLPVVTVAIGGRDANAEVRDRARQTLVDAIVALIPDMHLYLARSQRRSKEQSHFERHRGIVLSHASAAATGDALPAIGLLAVPTIQGRMLYRLARAYGIDWNAQRTRDFIATIGAGFVYRYALALMGRQAGKLIPVWGQSVGAAAAATVSFASTYGLGRAAAYYLFRIAEGEDIERKDLQARYRDAFSASLSRRS